MEIYLPPWILLLLPGWLLFVKIVWGTVRNCKQRRNFWSTFVKWKKQRSLHQWDSWHCIVCNTDSPIHIHKFIPPEVWKAFNVGINAWNIIAVPHSSGNTIWWISPFCLRSFHIHVKVKEMWPVCYSSWFNWRNSIPCTCCNVISLEHDWTPWWANSQRIHVDATSFCLLWKLCTIIKIFPRRLELDGGFKHLSKTT